MDRIIKICKCSDCFYEESEWNRGKQCYDLHCKKINKILCSGDSKTLEAYEIPDICPLAIYGQKG